MADENANQSHSHQRAWVHSLRTLRGCQNGSLHGAEVPSLPFEELFLQTATKMVLKRPELLPVLNSPQGIFINGFSYSHSPCGPSSRWIEQLQCDFLREGCEFMAPKSKRGKEPERTILLTDYWGPVTVQLWPLTSQGQGSMTNRKLTLFCSSEVSLPVDCTHRHLAYFSGRQMVLLLTCATAP